MAEKKKLIDEALLDIESIQAVLKANTKEILRATMHEEINAVVKESLNEADWDEEDVEDDEEPKTNDSDGGDGENETPAIPADTDDKPVADLDKSIQPEVPETPEIGGDDTMDTLDLTSASDDDVISVFKKLSGDDEIEVVSDREVKIKDPESGNEYIVTLGGSQPTETDTEIGSGLGAGVDLEPEIGGDDQMGNFGDEPSTDEPEMPETPDSEFGGSDDDSSEFEKPEEEEEDGVVYEVELREMEEISKRDGTMGKTHPKQELVGKGSMPTGDIEGQKAEMSKQYNPSGNANHSPAEGIGNAKLATGKIEGQKAKVVDRADVNTQGGFDEDMPGDGHAEHVMEEAEEPIEEKIQVGAAAKDGRKAWAGKIGAPKGAPANEEKRVKEEVIKRYNSMLAEVKALRQEREEFKTNLGKFRDMLGEAVVYNSNLTYIVKLFTEHSTTKAEKENIMKRFDSEVTSLKESKKLYKTLVNELGSKKTITESVIENTNKTQNSSTSQITESTAYVDSSTKRIIDLIQRVEKR